MCSCTFELCCWFNPARVRSKLSCKNFHAIRPRTIVADMLRKVYKVEAVGESAALMQRANTLATWAPNLLQLLASFWDDGDSLQDS